MAGKSFRLILFLTVALCLIVFPGCNGDKTKKSQEIAQTPMEIDKQQLMRQIDRDFEEPEPHYKLGQLYQSEGLWAQAQYEYNTALDYMKPEVDVYPHQHQAGQKGLQQER